MFKFLAVDPSLRNTGWVYGQRFDSEIKILDYGVVETYPSMSNKRSIALIFKELTKYKYDVLVAEGLSGGAKSAKAAWSLAAAQATVVCVVLHQGCEYVEHTPITIKKSVNAYRKKDIIAWAMKKYPNIKWHFFRGKPTLKYNEHIADTLAVIETTEKLKKWRNGRTN